MKKKNVKCPKCGAEYPLHIKELNSYICRSKDCEYRFTLKETEESKNIFISYGHDKFAELAIKIKNDLENQGHEVWFDVEKLKRGKDWEIYIENGIKGAEIVISMMTPHSVRRPFGFCLDEISMARTLNKNILPVMVRKVNPPLSIHRLQWLDFQEWPCSEEKYKEKFKLIQEVIEGRIVSFEGAHITLLKELNPIDFKVEIDTYVEHFYGREWIFEEIKDWLYSDSDSRIFFLTGKPGVGKTAISSMLCRKFPEVKAYHLVKFGDTRKTDAKECVLSLAYQLSTQISEYSDKLNTINFKGIREKTAMSMFYELIVEPLSTVTPPPKPVLIVIDALDEAKMDGKNILVEFIANTFEKVPLWVKLFITSRPEPEILSYLSFLKPYSLDTDDTRNITDLKNYLKLRLNQLFPDKAIDDAIETIAKHSEGIFLYVQEVLKELKLGRLNIDQPDKFPKGLIKVYKSFFNRQFPNEKDYHKHQRPLLSIISAAYEPLKVKFIKKLLGDTNLNLKRRIEPIGSLLEIEDDYIKPFHQSLIDWVSDEKTEVKYFIDKQEGHKILIEGWRSYQRDITKMSRYFLAYLPQHLLILEQWEDLFGLLILNTRYSERCKTKGLEHSLFKNFKDVISNENLPNTIKDRFSLEFEDLKRNILAPQIEVDFDFRFLIIGNEEQQKPFLTRLFRVEQIAWPPKIHSILYITSAHQIEVDAHEYKSELVFLANLKLLNKNKALFLEHCDRSDGIIIFYNSNDQEDFKEAVDMSKMLRNSFPELEIILTTGSEDITTPYQELERLEEKYNIYYSDGYESILAEILINVLRRKKKINKEIKLMKRRLKEIQEQLAAQDPDSILKSLKEFIFSTKKSRNKGK